MAIPTPQPQDFALSNVLRGLHDDLSQAAEKRSDSWEPMFLIDSADVELYVALKADRTTEGGVKAYVIDVGATKTDTNERSHKITLHLKTIASTAAEGVGPVPVKYPRKDPRLHGAGDKKTRR